MANNKNNSESQIKLKLTTPLQACFKNGILLGIMLFFTGIIAAQSLPNHGLFILSGIAIFSFSLIFTVLFYFLADNYYLLDLTEQKLIFQFRFLFFSKKRVIASFSEISSVGIRSYVVKHTSSAGPGNLNPLSSIHRLYQIVIALENMKLLKVSDYLSSNYNFVEKKAREIALKTGSTYVQGREKSGTDLEIYKNHSGKTSLRLVPLSFFKKHQQKFIFFFVYIATLVLFIGIGPVLL